jgi:FAD/FMN-containing dehydrogenase
MAGSANLADGKSEKRAKTGGRPAKLALDEMIANAERRGRLAALPDDTTVEAELAAFFLIISMSQLRELRKEGLPSEEDKLAARVEKAAEAAAKAAGRTRKRPDDSDAKPKGLRMIKIAEKGAVGSNQPVTYKMGDLKEFQRQHSGYGTFEVRLASAGLLGFVTEVVPFFASPKPDRKGRPILQCAGWGMDQAGREKLVASALAGNTRCVWLTPVQALHSLWETEKAHKAFAKPWIGLLKEEIGAAKAAIDRTAIQAVALEGRELKRKSKSVL